MVAAVSPSSGRAAATSATATGAMSARWVVPSAAGAGAAVGVAVRSGALHISSNDLSAEIYKHLVDVRSASCAGFVVGTVAPCLADGKCARSRDGAVFFQIGFVADKNNRYAFVVFYADYLVAELGEFVEGGH